ncbi:hypothetical protein ACPUYX_09900 [Desulfosporosinus sp. SYSU MS00001]|uniref:hypothetical protein n=1 Tax=Desulfosporosinus sp. SYSU MS00001 TaxID=3416284 RepID=UPI003CE914D6
MIKIDISEIDNMYEKICLLEILSLRSNFDWNQDDFQLLLIDELDNFYAERILKVYDHSKEIMLIDGQHQVKVSKHIQPLAYNVRKEYKGIKQDLRKLLISIDNNSSDIYIHVQNILHSFGFINTSLITHYTERLQNQDKLCKHGLINPGKDGFTILQALKLFTHIHTKTEIKILLKSLIYSFISKLNFVYFLFIINTCITSPFQSQKIKTGLEKLFDIFYKELEDIDIYWIDINSPLNIKSNIHSRGRVDNTTRITLYFLKGFSSYKIRLDLAHKGVDYIHINMDSDTIKNISYVDLSEFENALDLIDKDKSIILYKELTKFDSQMRKNFFHPEIEKLTRNLPVSHITKQNLIKVYNHNAHKVILEDDSKEFDNLFLTLEQELICNNFINLNNHNSQESRHLIMKLNLDIGLIYAEYIQKQLEGRNYYEYSKRNIQDILTQLYPENDEDFKKFTLEELINYGIDIITEKIALNDEILSCLEA